MALWFRPILLQGHVQKMVAQCTKSSILEHLCRSLGRWLGCCARWSLRVGFECFKGVFSKHCHLTNSLQLNSPSWISVCQRSSMAHLPLQSGIHFVVVFNSCSKSCLKSINLLSHYVWNPACWSWEDTARFQYDSSLTQNKFKTESYKRDVQIPYWRGVKFGSLWLHSKCFQTHIGMINMRVSKANNETSSGFASILKNKSKWTHHECRS